MKKTYIQPQIKSVKIECQPILAGSVIGTDVTDGTADGSLPSLVKRGEQLDDVTLEDDGEGAGFPSVW